MFVIGNCKNASTKMVMFECVANSHYTGQCTLTFYVHSVKMSVSALKSTSHLIVTVHSKMSTVVNCSLRLLYSTMYILQCCSNMRSYTEAMDKPTLQDNYIILYSESTSGEPF